MPLKRMKKSRNARKNSFFSAAFFSAITGPPRHTPDYAGRTLFGFNRKEEDARYGSDFGVGAGGVFFAGVEMPMLISTYLKAVRSFFSTSRLLWQSS